MSYLPRLLKILSIIAKYRLDQVPRVLPESVLLRRMIALLGLPWTGHAARALPPQLRLRLALEELGPIYIKLGQLLSTRRDFLPVELVDELQGLQDKVPPFLTPGIHELVETALGQPWQEVFSRLDSEALDCPGSQRHPAQWR